MIFLVVRWLSSAAGLDNTVFPYVTFTMKFRMLLSLIVQNFLVLWNPFVTFLLGSYMSHGKTSAPCFLHTCGDVCKLKYQYATVMVVSWKMFARILSVISAEAYVDSFYASLKKLPWQVYIWTSCEDDSDLDKCSTRDETNIKALKWKVKL